MSELGFSDEEIDAIERLRLKQMQAEAVTKDEMKIVFPRAIGELIEVISWQEGKILEQEAMLGVLVKAFDSVSIHYEICEKHLESCKKSRDEWKGVVDRRVDWNKPPFVKRT